MRKTRSHSYGKLKLLKSRKGKKITEDKIKKIYHAVKYAGGDEISRKEAFYTVETIVSSYYGFMSYYRAFNAMQVGGMYKKSIGVELLQGFLKLIFEEEKETGLELALDSLWAHIEHRQNFPSSCKMEDYKKIHKEFSAML